MPEAGRVGRGPGDGGSEADVRYDLFPAPARAVPGSEGDGL